MKSGGTEAQDKRCRICLVCGARFAHEWDFCSTECFKDFWAWAHDAERLRTWTTSRRTITGAILPHHVGGSPCASKPPPLRTASRASIRCGATWPALPTVVARRASHAPRLTCASGIAKVGCTLGNSFHGPGRM